MRRHATTASTTADSINKGRIHLRPKRLGAGFLLLCVLMLLAAINYGNNLVYLTSFLLFSLLVNSGWQTRRQLDRIEMRALPPRPRHAGQTGTLPLTLHADSDRPGMRIALHQMPTDPPDGSLREFAMVAGLPHKTTLALPRAPRGHHLLPALVLSTDYPLGLWEARRIDQPLAQAWVYPRSAGDQPLPSPDAAGNTARSRRTGEDELNDLRRYVPGDPLSHLAFKHFARTGELVTKRFAGQSGDQGSVTLDFDQLSGDPEARLAQLTQWVGQLDFADRPFALVLPDQRLASGQGARHCRLALEALALCRVPGQARKGAAT